MNAIVYVNTPLEAPEHAALAALAKKEGRAKGQQLRLLAIQAMRGGGSSNAVSAAGSDTARLREHAGSNANASTGTGTGTGRSISAAGSGDAPLAVPSPAPERVRAQGGARAHAHARTRTGTRITKGGRP
jgi:hypothetical protein